MGIMSTLDLNQAPSQSASSTPDPRRDALKTWAETAIGKPVRSIPPASADASFRRYFRLVFDDGTLVGMDAPPEREDCRPFVDVTRRLLAGGVHAPAIVQGNVEQGFLLLEDFGGTTYLESLNDSSADALYGAAMDCLLRIQRVDAAGLPPYDHALLWREMSLFEEWFLGKRLGIQLDDIQRTTLHEGFEIIAQSVLQQPRCFVHRDYHSRNLMVTAQDSPGVLDYQDAVLGPVTYDLMSLLRDAYVAWPRARVEAWVSGFADKAASQGLWPRIPALQALEWFDLMGAQRFLKVIGIFARLYIRDGKSRYLADIPRVWSYLKDVMERHAELGELSDLLKQLRIAEHIG